MAGLLLLLLGAIAPQRVQAAKAKASPPPPRPPPPPSPPGFVGHAWTSYGGRTYAGPALGALPNNAGGVVAKVASAAACERTCDAYAECVAFVYTPAAGARARAGARANRAGGARGGVRGFRPPPPALTRPPPLPRTRGAAAGNKCAFKQGAAFNATLLKKLAARGGRLLGQIV